MLAMAILILALWIYWKSNKHLRAEKVRMAQNIEALGGTIKYLKSENGRLTSQTDVLTLRLAEIKSLFPKTMADIHSLGISPRRVKSVSSTGISLQKNIVTILRDSVLYDTIPVRVFNYRDPWLELKGIAMGDSQRLYVRLSDTLIQAVYYGERVHPWLWVFSSRKLQQRVQLCSPYSSVFYQRTIEILDK
jgi:hypothetical protein